MKFAELAGWVEQHPTESIVIGGGGLIALLWLLGFFGSSSSSSSGSSNLASAYYAAEAQQAVVGGQIQMATIQTAGAVAQTAAQAGAAVAINAAQTGAATTINGQNTGAATTINQSNNDATTAQLGIVSSNQLLATYSNNGTALQAVQSNNATATQINQDSVNGNIFSNYINSIAAPELASGILPDANVGGVGGQSFTLGTSGPVGGTPSWYAATGYTPAQIAAKFG